MSLSADPIGSPLLELCGGHALAAVLGQARMPFDWSGVPGAAEYDARLARKLRAKAARAGGGSSSLAASSSSSVDFTDEDVVDVASHAR